MEEKPRLSAIDPILKIRIKAVEGFVCYLMRKGQLAVENAFLMKSFKSKFWLLFKCFGSIGHI